MLGLGLIYELFLVILRQPLESLLYGGQYTSYVNLIPLWGIVPLLLAINLSRASALQAVQRPQGLLIASAVWTVASVGSGFVFAGIWGVFGITLSAILGYAVMTAVFAILYKHWVGGGNNTELEI